MPDEKDDLQAVRVLVNTLDPFTDQERTRIIRWALEKLGNAVDFSSQTPMPLPMNPGSGVAPNFAKTDIKSFVESKGPKTDSQFAASVAYYYQFEAPAAERTESINSEILQEACRKVGRSRLNSPADTLNNTLKAGYLDRAGERGRFRINSVGENLVAMVLPDGGDSSAPRKLRTRSTRPKFRKAKPAKKSSARKSASPGRR